MTPRPDRGAGVIGSVAGLLVAVLFLVFGAQVLLGLYATSTLRASLYDAAARAARGGSVSRGELARAADAAEANLGEMGARTTIRLWTRDTDHDGTADVVVGEAVSSPPRLIPRSLGGMVGFEEIQVGVQVRIERIR